jgi:hypothetical protein
MFINKQRQENWIDLFTYIKDNFQYRCRFKSSNNYPTLFNGSRKISSTLGAFASIDTIHSKTPRGIKWGDSENITSGT